MIYGLVALPLMAGVGLAFDVSRTFSAREALQASIDSAVLAATRDLTDASLSDAAVITKANDFFQANLAAMNAEVVCNTPATSVNRPEYKITMTTSCQLGATVTGLVGVDTWTLNETGAAQANVTLLDLAMMVDISGSMSGLRIDALQVAAKDAVSILIRPETGDRVRIALAPYSSSLSVGGFGEDAFGPVFTGQRCASERTGAEAFTDALPGPGAWIETVPTYCPDSNILPLTYDTAELDDAIDGLVTSGGTAGHLGVAWSWYLISPEWRPFWPAGSEPLAAGKANTIRAVILMTDGDFNTTYAPQGDSSQQAIELCNGMKADGVLVFSVAFQAPPAGEATLLQCASEPSMYFDASSSAELAEAYQSIASSLAGLRLTD
jgi:Flp pilus assembly protein TadG